MLRLITIALLFLAAPIAAKAPDANASLESLLTADRTFSTEAAKAPDPVAGLGAMFDDEIVMPFPGKGILVGRNAALDIFRASPSYKDGKVSWAPIRGGISADGTQGFTFDSYR